MGGRVLPFLLVVALLLGLLGAVVVVVWSGSWVVSLVELLDVTGLVLVRVVVWFDLRVLVLARVEV